jgi:hypothetical protein
VVYKNNAVYDTLTYTIGLPEQPVAAGVSVVFSCEGFFNYAYLAFNLSILFGPIKLVFMLSTRTAIMFDSNFISHLISSLVSHVEQVSLGTCRQQTFFTVLALDRIRSEINHSVC